MNADLTQELLNEIGPSLERLEAQQGALVQFLRDKGIVTDEQLAPYLSQAGKASSVRWRAARVRLEGTISAAAEKEQRTSDKQEGEAVKTQMPPQEGSDNSRSDREGGAKSAVKEKTEAKDEKSEAVETHDATSAGGARNDVKDGNLSPQTREKDAA